MYVDPVLDRMIYLAKVAHEVGCDLNKVTDEQALDHMIYQAEVCDCQSRQPGHGSEATELETLICLLREWPG